jgi:hypothetical protein
MAERAPGQPRGISEYFYRLMLRAYPRTFRDEYATEMLLIFRDVQADTGAGWSLLHLWREVTRDFIASLCVQWTR